MSRAVTPPPTESQAVRIDQELLAAVRKAAVEEDRTVSSIIRIALREWLGRREKRPHLRSQ